MHLGFYPSDANDLNTIYFKTAFLQKEMKPKNRFRTTVYRIYKILKYNASLRTCKNNDDWDTIKESLNLYSSTLNAVIKDPSQTAKVQKMQANLKFPIDRLLQFITQSNSFLDQGTKFYQKFDPMLNRYKNQK